MGATWADDIFKCNIVNEDGLTSIELSPSFVPKGPSDNCLSLVQVMA